MEDNLGKFFGVEGYALPKCTTNESKVPMSKGLHPELDNSELLNEAGHRCYQQLIGSAQWLCGIGRADIQFSVTSLNRFSAAPRASQLAYCIRMFSFLKEFPEREIVIDHRDHEFFAQFGEPDPTMEELYPDSVEELDENMPEAFGPELQTSVWFDSDHGHDALTKRSCTGLVVMVGRTPVYWSAKRQTSIQTSSYSAEFMAGRSACEEAISLRYMLRCLGVKIKGRTFLAGDNLGMLQSSTIVSSMCKKKHISIAYHKMRECVAAGIINPVKVHTDYNVADFLTKSLAWKELHYHSGSFFSRWTTGTEVDWAVTSLDF